MKAKISLAFTDVGLVFSRIPDAVYGFLVYSNEPEWCDDDLRIITYGLNGFFSSAAGFTLAVIAVQRLYAVINPISYRKVSARRHNIHIVMAWLPSFLCIAGHFYGAYGSRNRAMNIVGGFLFAAIPLLTINISTISLLMVHFTIPSQLAVENVGVTFNRKKNHLKIIRITMLMVLGYTLTVAPFNLTYTLYFFQPNATAKDYGDTPIQIIFKQLYKFNSIVNILVYSVADKQFRLYLKSVLKTLQKFIFCRNHELVAKPRTISTINITVFDRHCSLS